MSVFLNFVAGPGQVGKTTLIKLVIHELLEEVDRRCGFYYLCDEISDYVELGEVPTPTLPREGFGGEHIVYLLG
ncbi:MAG: hypothetical protein QW688_07160 [Thermoprotei archaeon]